MAVRLSAPRAGRPLSPERFLVFISVRGWVDPRAIVRLEGLDQLKNPMTSSGIEPATFRLVACWYHWLIPSWYVLHGTIFIDRILWKSARYTEATERSPIDHGNENVRDITSFWARSYTCGVRVSSVRPFVLQYVQNNSKHSDRFLLNLILENFTKNLFDFHSVCTTRKL
jgi:hypothetical protein